jgi:hypothetical protein
MKRADYQTRLFRAADEFGWRDGVRWCCDRWARAAAVPVSTYLLLIILLIALVLSLAPTFGQSIDIQYSEQRGRETIAFYFGELDSKGFLSAVGNTGRNYGPFFDVVIAFVQNMISDDEVTRFDIRTFMQALITLSCLVPAFLILSRVVSRPLAFIGVVLLASTPVLLGHAFINAKDAPFASMLIWSIYLIIYTFDSLEEPRHGRILLLGAFLAVTISLRAIAAYLFAIILLAAIVLPALQAAQKSDLRIVSARVWSRLRQRFRGLLLLLIVTAIVYIAVMPGLLAQFSSDALASIVNQISRFPFRGSVRYFGETIASTKLPWHYTYGYMLMQMPLYYHIFIVMGVLALSVFLGRSLRGVQNDQIELSETASYTIIILLAATIIPALIVFLAKPVFYNATRHMLFMVPLIFMVLFLVFVAAAKLSPSWLRVSAVLFVFACWLEVILAMLRIHPYEYAYYNPLVRDAARTFSSEYWNTSFREAAAKLNEYAAGSGQGKLRVYACHHANLVAPFLDKNKFEMVGSKNAADLIVGRIQSRKKCKIGPPWFITIGREGIIYTVVARNTPKP